MPEVAIEVLERNTAGELVGRERKSRPFITRRTEFGTDARAACEFIEDLGGANGRRRIVVREDAQWSHIGLGADVFAAWQEVRRERATV
jgi:hypothetical protein